MEKVLNIIVSIIAIILLFLGLLFKVESWEGATEMLIIGLSSSFLLLIYYFKKVRRKPINFNLASGLASLGGSIIILGAWFRIESWERATEMLIIGFSILILSVIIYVYRAIKAKDFSKAITFSGLTLFLAGSLCKIESWESGLELSLIGRILIYLGVFMMIFKVIKEKIKQ